MIRSAIPLLILAGTSLGGCDWMKKKEAPEAKSEREIAAEERDRLRRACASEGTYDRLKELIFDEAARIRRADPRELDPLAAAAVVRMEEPLVKSRDETLNVTVCTGRFVLDLPPGAENAFDGERRLTADVEYAAQAALDGSGLVYQMDGAEPIIYRLASLGVQAGQTPNLAAAAPPAAPATEPEPARGPAAVPEPARRAPMPAPAPPQPRPSSEPKAGASAQTVRPSFNCRYAKTRTEKMVCGSAALAARDREMASLYYALMAEANGDTRSRLRRSRDAFLGRRERCTTEACVAAAYAERTAELRRIAGGT